MFRQNEPNGHPGDREEPRDEEGRLSKTSPQPSLEADVFAAAFARNPMAIAIMRPDNPLIFEVNESWRKMFGYSRDDVLVCSAISLCLWPTRGDVDRFAQELRDYGGFRGLEQNFFRKSGESFVALTSAEPKNIPGEELILSTWRDITDRKRAEEELRQKEHLLSESQRIAHVGSWSLDMHEENIKWTDETYRIYGVKPDTFVPTIETLIGLIHPADQQAMKEWIGACFAGECPDALEFRVVHSDGTVRIPKGRGVLEHDLKGIPSRMVGTVQDVTERKHAEEALRKANAELEIRVQVFRAMGAGAGWV